MPTLTRDYSAYLSIEISQCDISCKNINHEIQINPFDAQRLFHFGCKNMLISIIGQIHGNNQIIAEKVLFDIHPAPAKPVSQINHVMTVH